MKTISRKKSQKRTEVEEGGFRGYIVARGYLVQRAMDWLCLDSTLYSVQEGYSMQDLEEM